MPLGHRRTSKARYASEYGASVVLSFLFLTVLFVIRRYRVVHVHTMPDILVLAALVCKLFGARILLDVHDPMPETLGTKFGIDERHWLWKLTDLQERVSIRMADHVITVTHQVRDALIQRGAPEGKVSVVMNVADPRRFPADTRQQSRPLSGQETTTLLFMGTITWQYGVDVLVDALAILRGVDPAFRLKIVGDGEEREQVREQVRHLGLEDHVAFHDPVPISRLPEVALPADIGVAPHRVDRLYDMCFPSKMYDYLMLGLPVIAARTKSIVHYYGEDTVGLFEAGDADALAEEALRLVRDPDLVRTRRARADEFLSTLNWREEERRYLGVIRALSTRGER